MFHILREGGAEVFHAWEGGVEMFHILGEGGAEVGMECVESGWVRSRGLRSDWVDPIENGRIMLG